LFVATGVGSTFVLLGTMVNLDLHQPSSIFCWQVPTYEIHVDGYRLVEELNDIYNSGVMWAAFQPTL
jgi:hypothetical protein